jgi:stringent starvation protein B
MRVLSVRKPAVCLNLDDRSRSNACVCRFHVALQARITGVSKQLTLPIRMASPYIFEVEVDTSQEVVGDDAASLRLHATTHRRRDHETSPM